MKKNILRMLIIDKKYIMKNILTPLLLVPLIAISFSNCRHKKPAHEYYIISSGDSTNFGKKYEGTDESGQYLPPPPPPPQEVIELEGGRYYFNTTIIFDSTDLVYLYQTDTYENKESIIKAPHACTINEDDDYHKLIKYPCFIALITANMMKFSKGEFINFVVENEDLLGLNDISKSPKVLILASTRDTIINAAFYDFMNLIIHKKESGNHIYCHIRRTTEEEDTAIVYKRKNMTYDPYSIHWSNNFLNGKYSPLSKEYDSIENFVIPVKSKARTLFRPDFNNQIPIDRSRVISE
jgi:hypothetical protein